MSELVLSWLNSEVRLSRKVVAFERDFANGYLFGELLHTHGFLNDFEAFVDGSTLHAKKGNFEKLKAALKGPAGKLGVKLSDELIEEVMDEDRGSALRLLYQLRKGLSGTLSHTPTGEVSPKRDLPSRVAKVRKGENEERFFDTTFGALRHNERRVGHEVHAKPFADKHASQIRTIAELDAKAATETRDRLQDFRMQRMDALKARQAASQQSVAAGQVAWHVVQSRKAATIQNDLRFEKEMIRREREKIERIREQHRAEVGYAKDDESNGVQWFERNLQRIGIDTSEHSGSTGTPIVASSLQELYEKMQEKLPTQAQLQIEASQRMKKIREAKRATDLARKERERRQHRVHVEQQATQILVEEQKTEEDQLSWLLRATMDYRNEAVAHEHARNLKEAARVEREARQLAAEKSAREVPEAVGTASEALDRPAPRTREERREVQSSDEEDGQDPVAKPDTKAVDQQPLDTIAGVTAVPSATIAGNADISAPSVAPVKKLVDIVQDARVADYLFARGEWQHHQPGEAVPGPTGRRLGTLVHWLCAVKEPASAGRSQLLPKGLPVVSINGSPAGLGDRDTGLLATLQRRLCEEFGFALLDPSKIIKECVALASNELPDTEWPILLRMQQLGKKVVALQCQASKVGIPPAICAEMIFRKIELLAAPPPKAVQEEDVPDPKKKKAPPKGKEKKEEEAPPEKAKGVLIAGFPTDLGQQVAMEAVLHGYTSPLLRLLDGEEDRYLQLSALLAPWWREDDAVQVADVEEQAVGEKAKQASVPTMRLCHLQQRHLAEVELVSMEIATVDAGAAGSPLCQGYDTELAHLTNPVDRAWLYEESQVFAQAFASPLGTIRDISIAVPMAQEGEVEASSLEEACYRQLREAVSDVQRRLQGAAAEREAAGASPPGRAVAEAFGDALADGATPDKEPPPDGDVDAADVEDDATVSKAGARWGSMGAEARERMRHTWLEGLSAYLVGVQRVLGNLQDAKDTFGNELVKLQRHFLEFLQRSDDKPLVFEEFLRKGQTEDITEHIEDLSDHLWQIANRRRAESVEERLRLLNGGFWDQQAANTLRLAYNFFALEYGRFCTSFALLAEAYNQELPAELKPIEDTCLEGPASLSQSMLWLSVFTEQFAGNYCVEAAENGPPEFYSAVVAEQQGHKRRLQALSAWMGARLQTMRSQFDEVFRRMDDWIRDRVKAENDGIKAAVAQVRHANWDSECEDEPPSPASPGMKSGRSIRSKAPGRGSKLPPSPQGGTMRRKKREFLKALEARTLDVDVYQPAKTALPDLSPRALPQEAPREPSRGPFSGVRSRTDGSTVEGGTADRWSQTKLCVLAQSVLERFQGAAAVPAEGMFQLLCKLRNETLSWEFDYVPQAWVSRAEAALKLFCQAHIAPRWGCLAIDVTEMLLNLTYVGRDLVPPSMKALQRARQLIESAEGGLTEEQRATFPDVPISEELFVRLRLWEEAASSGSDDLPCKRHEARIRWIFRIFRCFENENQPQLLTMPGRPRGDGSAGTISARRLFTYLGLGTMPSDGLQRALALLMPLRTAACHVEEDHQAAPKILVQDLWRVLFSQRGRPTCLVAPPPPLMQLCKELLPKVYDKEAYKAAQAAAASAAAADSKAKPKSKAVAKSKGGKVSPEPVLEEEEDVGPPPPPEEATLSIAEVELGRHPAVLRALLSHGALLCRRRAIAVLFPEEGAATSLATAGEAAQLRGLESLVPVLPSEPSSQGSPDMQ